MTDAVTDQEVELTPEQEAAADAEFEAAFNLARGDAGDDDQGTSTNNDADANADKDQGNPDDGRQQDADDEAAAQAAAEAAANAPVTITKADYDRLMGIANEVPNLRDQLTRTHDTVAGRIGSLQQTITALKAKAEGGSKASIKQLKRLEAEFPELANLLKEDLSEVFGGSGGEPDQLEQQQGDAPLQSQQQPANPLERPEVQRVLRLKEVEIVEAVHPGFRSLAQTPEFNEWKATLPPVAVNLLESSWDSKIMVPAFNDFKKWKAERNAKLDTKKQNDKRLERGIAPTDGATRTGQHVVDEDAAFEAGFRSVRGR